MGLTHRFLAIIVSLAWLAAVAVGVYLIWDQGRAIDWSSGGLGLNLDIAAQDDADKVIATLIAAAVALPAALLLLTSFVPFGGRSRADSDYESLQSRVDHLEQERAGRRAAEEAPSRPDSPAASVDEGQRRRRGLLSR